MAKIKNLNKVIANIKKFGKDAEQITDLIINAGVNDIVLDARNRARTKSRNLGNLERNITSEKIKDLRHNIFVGGEAQSYAPYVEFGTGKQVSVPSELKNLAIQFKGKKGGFKKGLQSIKDWCRNKGIDEENAFPIFMAILKKGLTPRPFLYPAVVKGRKDIYKDLESELKHLTNKANG